MQNSTRKRDWRALLEMLAAIAGILGLLVALGQWLLPSPSLGIIPNFLSLQNILVFSLAVLIIFDLSISPKLLARQAKFSVWITNIIHIFILIYAFSVGIIISNKQRALFVLNNSNASKLYSNNGASIESQPDGSVKVVGGWDQVIWIDQELPEDYRFNISFKTNDANSLNIGFGDGENKNPSFLFVLGDRGTYFVKWDRDIWDTITTKLTNPIDTIKSNSRYIITIERKQNIIQVFLNGSKLLENVRIPSELRNLKRLYFATNASIENSNDNKRGTTTIENISIENLD